MKKAGRPSSTPKRLKDGYYMSIKLSATSKPIRIMRETSQQMEQARDQYKERNFKYIGQVKDHFWIDGENKGKTTS
tara:strand:- start:474 stop:701 length:228 start_codon:yes stop_codon:yes gene_type:complete